MIIKGKSELEIHTHVQCGYLSLNSFPNGDITVECLNQERDGLPIECDYYKSGKCDYRDTKKTLGEVVAERALTFTTNICEAINYVNKHSKKRKD